MDKTQTTNNKLMIYGAYGYTGKLIAAEAKQRGLAPLLAGRDQSKLTAMANELNLPSLCVNLDDVSGLGQALADIDIVIHCAGPFSATAEPMMRACLQSHTHYLDITGEIQVFELAQEMARAAQQADIIICPGVGFDVIPTDCLAVQLKQALPDADFLALGFDSRSSFSPGTAKTSVEGLGMGGKIRKNGSIVNVPFAYKVRDIDFGQGVKQATTIPWGDVSTAYYSTGIGNIEVYIPLSPKKIKVMKRLNWFKPLLSLRFVQRFLQKQIVKKVRGPSEQDRKRQLTYIWGEVSNASGNKVSALLQTANGYDVTVSGALAVVEFIQAQQPTAGAFTPAQLLGSDLISQLPGSSEIIFTQHNS